MTEAIKSPDQTGTPTVPSRNKPAAPIMVNTGVTEDRPEASAVITPATKFYRGKFANKSNPTDPDSVMLSVNGEVLSFQRAVETIVPEPYLEVAKHATYPKFKQEPGQGRKIVAYISRYPFEPTGEATFEEFKEEFTKGSRKTKLAIQQHGLNVPVEQAVPQLV